MNVNKTQRLHYLDIAKGILILLLLVSHLGIALKWCGIDDTNPNFLPWQYPQPIFTCFIMQGFFIISGYCSNFDVGIPLFVKKLLRQLIIPWLFFELVRVCFFAAKGEAVPFFPDNSYTSLWFLNALATAKIICYVIHRYIKSEYAVFAIPLSLLLIGVGINQFIDGGNFLAYKQSLIDSFFVAVGFLLKKHQNIFDYLIKYSGILFLLIIFGRFLHLYELPGQDAIIGVTLQTTPLFLLTSLSGSLGLIFLCKLINHSRLIEFFGRNSLVIYGIHMWPYTIIITILAPYFNLSYRLLALSFLVCIYLSELLILSIAIKALNIKGIRFFIGK